MERYVEIRAMFSFEAAEDLEADRARLKTLANDCEKHFLSLETAGFTLTEQSLQGFEEESR